MIVQVNGNLTELPDGATVGQLVDHLDVPHERRGIAVAVSAEVVPRSAWDDVVLEDGANVEILTAIQGG